MILPRFLTGDELAAARDNLLQYFPTAQELAATPQRYGSILEDPDHLQIEFPFAGDALNDISTHPELIAFVEQLLGTRDVLLSQAAIWAKYAGIGGDFEHSHAGRCASIRPGHAARVQKQNTLPSFVSRHVRVSVHDDVDIIRRTLRRDVLQTEFQSVTHKIDNQRPFGIAVAISAD